MAEDPPSMNHNCKIFIPTILFSSLRKCKGELRLLLPQILMKHGVDRSREALIKSLSDFILGFLCNARNNSTQIASYLRQQSCIGLLSQDKLIGQPLKGKRFNGQAKRQCAAGLQVLCRTCTLSLHIKALSFYSWPSYDEAVHKNPYKICLCELISASQDWGVTARSKCTAPLSEDIRSLHRSRKTSTFNSFITFRTDTAGPPRNSVPARSTSTGSKRDWHRGHRMCLRPYRTGRKCY